MQLSKIAVPRTLFGKVALYGAILLLLAAALTGFFLVINFLVDLVSLGPRDLVAPNTSTEDNISVPSGIEVVVFAVSTLSIILGTTMLIVLRRWKLSRPFIRSSGTLLVGVLIAGLIVGAGLFLSFSGVLGEGISYAQHEAQRSYIDPAGIAVLGLIFLSIVFVGIIMPRLLLPLLAVFLLAGFGFGLLEPKGLEGLHLFNRPSHLEKPLAYAITVEEYRRGLDTSGVEIDADSSIETDKIETALVGPGKTRELAPVQPLPYGTVVSLDSIISAEQMHPAGGSTGVPSNWCSAHKVSTNRNRRRVPKRGVESDRSLQPLLRRRRRFPRGGYWNTCRILRGTWDGFSFR